MGSNPALHRVAIANKVVPQVIVAGAVERDSFRARPMQMTAQVRHATCVTDPEVMQLDFVRSLTSMSWPGSRPTLDPKSSKTTSMVVLPKTLKTGFKYDFEVQAVSKKDPLYKGNAFASVTVIPDRVYARQEGGSRRKAPMSLPLMLDASPSYDPAHDPENNPTAFTYSWSCDQNGVACLIDSIVPENVDQERKAIFAGCRSNSHWLSNAMPKHLPVSTVKRIQKTYNDLYSNSTVNPTLWKDATPCLQPVSLTTIPGNVISSNGTYTFVLTVSKPGEYMGNPREDSSSSNVEYVESLPPRVAIQPMPQIKMNANEKVPIKSASESYMNETLTYLWMLTNGDASFNLTRANLATSINSVIKPDKLSVGITYSFMLKASDSGGKGFAEIDVPINIPPRGGTFTVSPLEGIASNTTITLTLRGWTDNVEDLPLKYQYSYFVGMPSGDLIVDKAKEVVEGAPSDKTRVMKEYPEGDKNFSAITVIGNVVDAYRGTQRNEQVLTIRKLEMPAADATKYISGKMDSKLGEQMLTGDNSGAVGSVGLFANVLNGNPNTESATQSSVRVLSEDGKRAVQRREMSDAIKAATENAYIAYDDLAFRADSNNEVVSSPAETDSGTMDSTLNTTSSMFDSMSSCDATVESCAEMTPTQARKATATLNAIMLQSDLNNKVEVATEQQSQLLNAHQNARYHFELMDDSSMNAEMAKLNVGRRPLAATALEAEVRANRANRQAGQVSSAGTSMVTGMNAQTLIGEDAKEASSSSLKMSGKRVDEETVAGDRSLTGDEGSESPATASVPPGMPTGGGEAVGDMRSSKVDIYQNMAANASKPTSELLTYSQLLLNGNEIQVAHLDEPFSFMLKNKRNDEGKLLVAACRFWDKNTSDWAAYGCIAVKIVGNYTQCNCTHLTDFANAKPKYNAVDPIAGASSLVNISWQNMTAIATIACFLVIYTIWILYSFWLERRDSARMAILMSFGAQEEEIKDVKPETKLQAAFYKLKQGFTEQHQWTAAFLVKTGQP